jgi:choline dehydrogenase
MFDYIVVGAGSAGCIVAARLSEDRGISVLLIETGSSYGGVTVDMPAAMAYPLTNKQLVWTFETGPEPQLNGRHITHVRGKLLGGSSSVNGMVYVRGNRRDFDGWAATGLPDWDFDHCLPYFKRLETFEGGDARYRGAEGPVRIVQAAADHPLYNAFLSAGQQAGERLNSDYNGQSQEGVTRYQANIDNGRRASTAHAYLRPAKGRRNLTVQTGMTVTRTVFSGRRAIGVEIAGADGMVRQIEASAEVIICAGAYNSPHLLLLSGIGDADRLSALDVPVIAHVPGVGHGLEDHPAAQVAYRSPAGTSPVTNMGPFRKLAIGAQWLLTRSGLGATNFWEVGAFIKSAPETDFADIQHEFCPMLGDLAGGEVNVADGFQYAVNLMRPRSRGAVTLKSRNPAHPPSIVTNYLSHPDDRRDLMAAIRKTDEIVQQSAWDSLRRDPIVEGGLRNLSDPDLSQWLSSNVGTQYHPSSTCRMGVDDRSVTDDQGRVHGVDGLRVIDASVMPHITSGNLNCPTMMIAEKLVDRVRGRATLSPLTDSARRQ